jgi:hypothetical protein
MTTPNDKPEVPFDDATLRDMFASSSLQGLLSNPENSRFSANVIAALAYSIADSMLEARDRKKG